MTGDQQPEDLLDLPFDQYQRYRIVSELLSILARQEVFGGDGAAVSILDVGGYPGLLPRFVPIDGARTIILDVVPDTSSARRYDYAYVVGSGMELPFPDASFSCVVSLDTLEHIPATDRPAFLSEMRRVARDAAIFIGPVHRPETALSEELLFDYIQWLLKARQEQLAEHRDYGLPDLEAVRRSFGEAGWATGVFSAGNLYNWLFMMVAKHYLISLRDEQAAEFERKLDHFYNLSFSEGDRQDPAYRGVVVATRSAGPSPVAAVGDRYPPMAAADGANLERLELAQLLMRLLDLKVANHEDRGLREQLEHRDKHVAGLERRVDMLERELESSRRHSANLDEALSGARQHAANLQLIIDDPSGGIGALTNAVAELNGAVADLRAANAAAAADIEGLTAEANHLRSEFYKALETINALESELGQKNEHILYLEQLLQKIEAGTVLRLTRSISRLIK